MSDQKEHGTESVTLNHQPDTKKRCQCDKDKSAVKEKGLVNEKNDEGNDGESDHEVHLLMERERRKKMRTMFIDHHALLPQLPPKDDKSSIVEEPVHYIGNLQGELEKLQRLKDERVSRHGSADLAHEPSIVSFNQIPGKNNYPTIGIEMCLASSDNDLPVSYSTRTSPSVTLNVNGDSAQMSIYAIPRPGLFSTICYVMEKHGSNVVSAHVCSDSSLSHYMIQAQVKNGGTDGDDHQQNHHHRRLKVLEAYKQATNKIILGISSL